jgi:hypothetical protein
MYKIIKSFQNSLSIFFIRLKRTAPTTTYLEVEECEEEYEGQCCNKNVQEKKYKNGTM